MIVESGSNRLIINELPAAVALYVGGRGGGHTIFLEAADVVAIASELVRIADGLLRDALDELRRAAGGDALEQEVEQLPSPRPAA